MYWNDNKLRNELNFTIELTLDLSEYKLKRDGVYKILILWRFVDYNYSPPKPIPIAGFYESKVISIEN